MMNPCTLGFSFSPALSKVPSVADSTCGVGSHEGLSQGAQRRPLPERKSGERSPAHPGGRGQRPGSTPAYWLNARAALRPPQPPGPDSPERSAPRALCCTEASGSRGRGLESPGLPPPPPWAHTQTHTHTLPPWTHTHSHHGDTHTHSETDQSWGCRDTHTRTQTHAYTHSLSLVLSLFHSGTDQFWGHIHTHTLTLPLPLWNLPIPGLL